MIRKIKRKINAKLGNSSNSAIFKNMLKLVAGDGIARTIGILTTPIIARIYTPSEMGVLSVFISILAILAPFASLKYSAAIPLPRSNTLSFNLFALCAFLILVFTGLLFVIFACFKDSILELFSVSEILPYWWLIPISFCGKGFYELLSMWATRTKSFSTLAKTKVTQKITGSVSKIALGLIGLKPLGLIIGEILTQQGGVIRLFGSFRSEFKLYKSSVKRKLIVFLFKYYSKFPRYRLPANFLLILAGKIPILFFAMYYDKATCGQLGLATTMLSIPITLIGYSTGKAFYSEIASLGRDKGVEIYKLTVNVVKKLFIFSIIPFLTILASGPLLFKIFFGEEWIQAGQFARIMSVYLLMQFIYAPIGDGIINTFKKQQFGLIIDSIRLLIVGAIFGLAYYFKADIYTTITAYSAGLTLHYIIATLIIFKILKATS